MLRRLLLGGGMPDLITVLVTTHADGGYDVQYIYSGRPAIPKEPPPMATLTETRTTVDALIRDRFLGDEHFAQQLRSQHIGVGYTIYPWRSAKMPKELASKIGEFLVIVVDEIADGFIAHVDDLTVTARDLDVLTPRTEKALRLRWPELPDSGLPAMFNWQRRLVATGWISPPPWKGNVAPRA